ncbi:Zinc knuckle family protein [Dorcoceras hygrometricum]|uniref:Zinc knuckle family protein n=1 Tax=Dorcoceras hygrometricum TaxID=472368 RepID=A0A2Z6ZXD6_9LAMI|nr:Zinc knuckle family protein [Dorcoceras hygrometricum]
MGFGSGPTGPGPTDEHSFHLHHRDFTVTPIADQIGPIDSVSETEYNDLNHHFSEPQCKMTVLPLNSGKPRFDPCCLLGSRTSRNPLLVLNTLS